jgi:DNA-directed RNA polymerase specialized sigma24 family protein
MTFNEASGSNSADARYTPDEIRNAIEAMSADDLRRLEAVARHFAPRSGMDVSDLRQEAFLRVLGTRTCSVNTTLLDFLAGTIRSIASESPRARRKAREDCGLELVYIAAYGKDRFPDPEADVPSPEDAALSQVAHSRELTKALTLIAGDEELELLAEGLFDGMRGKDLEALLSTDTKGLAAAKKRLARKLLTSFPVGVPL